MPRYKVFLLYALILLPSLAIAEVRSLDKARELAYDFMQSKMPRTKSSSMNLRMVYSGEDVLTKSSLDPAYYVFNNESGPGFVVISGDDCTLPVLGFSSSYNFKNENMPANLRWWLRHMNRKVIAARQAGLQGAVRLADVGNDMLYYDTAIWDQTEPYNSECPMDGGEHSVTGCGPTALAIAMRYREWPAAGNGNIPSYYSEDANGEIANGPFPGRTLGEEYNWKNMPLTDGYYGTWTSEQERQVASLMADLGAATHADYSADGTGIWDEDVPPAMKTYFGYDQSMTVEFRQDWNVEYIEDLKDQYTPQQWYQMVKDELMNGPAIYAGADEEGGHMFVISGYTDKEYYYVNWGWGGWANGYYALEALTPDDPNDDYYMGSFHEYESLMVNFKKPANFDTDSDDDTDTDPVYNLKENAFLVYDHASRKLSITVENGASVSAKSEKGESVPVISAGSGVYEIDARGLSGVYDMILSKGSSQEVVQIILGE